MRRIVLAGIFALAASTALAQTDTSPEPAIPQPGTPVPATPETAAPSDPAATQQARAGQPANLCQELLAFVQENSPEADVPTEAPAVAAAPDEPSDADGADGDVAAEAPGQSADDAAAAGEETAAAAGEDSSPASGEAVPPQSPSESTSAQDISGQSGPAHEAPDPNTQEAAQGNVENAPQTSGLSAPVPTEAKDAGEDIPLSLAGAEELADTNDIAACQQAARKLRLAGAAMPPPLLALTALDLQYQRASETDTPAAVPESPQQ